MTNSVFYWINLKPASMSILNYLNEVDQPMKAEDIAEALNMKVRAVDAAVTRSLVHYGLAVREAKLTAVLKKEYNMIRITDMGKRFMKSKTEQEN